MERGRSFPKCAFFKQPPFKSSSQKKSTNSQTWKVAINSTLQTHLREKKNNLRSTIKSLPWALTSKVVFIANFGCECHECFSKVSFGSVIANVFANSAIDRWHFSPRSFNDIITQKSFLVMRSRHRSPSDRIKWNLCISFASPKAQLSSRFLALRNEGDERESACTNSIATVVLLFVVDKAGLDIWADGSSG